MAQPILIAPSILSADFARLAEEIAAVEQAGADLLHVDVMDGHFVPNLTVGPPIIESLKKVTKLPLDVHLMITNADAFILGADARMSYALGDTAKLTANLGVGYDVINDRNSVTSAFVGGGAAFSTKGIDQSPWIIRGGLGYVMAKSKAMEVSARYDFETRSSDFTNQTASINLRMPF